MNIKIIFALMLIVSIGYSIDFTLIGCYNATYQSVTDWTNISGTNTTTKVTYLPTAYGCDLGSGAAIDESIFNFEGVVILAWAILAALSLYALKIFKEHDLEETSILNTGLRVFFLSMALFFQLFMFQELGSYTQRISNTIVNNSGSIATTFAGVFFWIVFLILFMTFVSLGIDVFKNYKQGKREKNEE